MIYKNYFDWLGGRHPLKIRDNTFEQYVKSVPELTNLLDLGFSLKDIKYCLNEKIPFELGTCVICGNPTHVKNTSYGFTETCSHECAKELGKIHRVESNIKKYGVTYPTMNKDFMQRIKETNLKKYGSTCSLHDKNGIISEKVKQTNLKKYGTEYASQSKVIKEKVKQTTLERYGVESAFQSEAVKEKAKATNLKKYGVEHTGSSPIVREKIRKTCLETYGVSAPVRQKHVIEKAKAGSKTETAKNKRKATNLEKYGVEHAAQSSEIKEKIKNTNLEKYGVECTLHAPEIKEKVKQTNLERYGVENPFCHGIIREKIFEQNIEKYGSKWPQQNDEVNNKKIKTCLEKYGTEEALSSTAIREKIKLTNLKKYGVENPFQAEIIKDKIKQTNIKRYGVEYIGQSITALEKKRIISLDKSFKRLLEFENTIPNFSRDEWFGFSDKCNVLYEWKCKKCGKTFMKNISNNKYYPRCPDCFPNCNAGISQKEIDVLDYIKTIYDGEIISSSFSIISPKQLDIFLPDLNIAFEFNGIYYHSIENGKTAEYHLEKSLMCLDKGIKLFHIWEHEWDKNKEFIKEQIKKVILSEYDDSINIDLSWPNVSMEVLNKLNEYIYEPPKIIENTGTKFTIFDCGRFMIN